MKNRTALALALSLALIPTATAAPATASPPQSPGPISHRLPKKATMTGSGGAAASVDPIATQTAIDVLARGGTAADAAVAATAVLNVVEPYATGLGGGGFFVHYDAKTKKVQTIDGRETAPASIRETSFLEPDGKPMNFDKAVNSGLSVGVPGNPAIWQMALKQWGKRSLSQMLQPAEEIARRGFVVDQAFSAETADNAKRFAKFPATAAIFLPGGKPIQPGTVLRQPDLARTYHLLRTQGPDALYRGPIGKAIVNTVNHPATAPGITVPAGGMTMNDLANYRALPKEPIVSKHKNLTIYGMPTSSGGGTAVAEILNLMQETEKQTGTPVSKTDNTQYLHRFAEASAAAFTDRNRWVADVPGAPVNELISPAYATERACGFNPDKAAQRPIAFGNPDGKYGPCKPRPAGKPGKINEGASTTHLTVADRWGNVASYTSTIEQFGGSGMVVPGYGFLLNNQ
ncbi:gamma-glutamyltransferase family protein, partial [Dermatophilus congolensis]